MLVYSKPTTQLIEGVFVNLWQHGVIYAYATSLSKPKLENVKQALGKMGYEDIVIEPITNQGKIVGWALSAAQYPKE
jgi:hypothetical protein